MAGNFSLTRQRKVTKRGALNAIRTRAAACARDARSASCLHATRCALAAVPVTTITDRRFTTVNAGCTPGSSGNTEQPRRPSDAVFGFLVSSACSRAFIGPLLRAMVLVIGSAARAQRVASSRNAAGRFRAPLIAASRWCAVQGLFFGDFLLAPQKKVTRPPGRTPGNAAMRWLLRQNSQQLLVNAAKPAMAHAKRTIARLGCLDDRTNERIDI